MGLKILWITDTHLRSKFKFGAEPDKAYGSVGLKRIALSLHWVLDLVKQHRPDYFVFGGDLVDKSAFDYLSFGVAFDFFAALSRQLNPQNVFILRGNHDIHSNNINWDHALHSLSPFGQTISDPATIPLDEIHARFVPYCDRSQLLEHVKINPTNCELAFAHVGAKDHIFADGRSFGDFTFDDFKSNRIYCGHYHIPSSYYQGRWLYTGALIPKDFSDQGDHPFGAWLISISANEQTGKISHFHTVFPNPHAPRFLKTQESAITLEYAQKVASSPNTYLDVITEDPAGLTKRLSKQGLPDLQQRIVKMTPKEERTVEIPEDVSLTATQILEPSKLTALLKDYCTASKDVEAELIEDYVKTGNLYLQNLYEQDVMSREGYSVVSFEASGFFSIENAKHTVEPGITVIEGHNNDDGGSNGAGKSSLTEAIYYALFGETIRDVPKIEQIVNTRVGETRCQVVLKSKREGKFLRITRHRNHSKHKNTVHMEVSNNGALWVNRTAKKVADTEASIKAILGITPQLYKLTVLMSQHSTLASRSTDGERSELFLQFLDLGFESGRENLHQQVLSLKDQLLALQADKTNFDMNVQKDMSRVSALLERLQKELDTTDQTNLHAELQKNQKRLLALEREISEDIPEVADAENEAKTYRELISELTKTSTKQITNWTRDLQDLKSECERLEQLDGHEECPLCKTILDKKSDHYDPDALNNARTRAGDLAANLKEYQHKTKQEKTVLQEQLKAAEASIAHVSRLRSERAKKESELAVVRTKVNHLQEVLRASKDKVDAMQAEKEELLTQKKEIECREWVGDEAIQSTEAEVKKLSFWRRAFAKSGIPRFLLSRMLEFANSRVAIYASILLQRTATATFEISSSQGGVSIQCSRDGVPLSYANLSDGQRTCVDLSVQLALHDVAQLSFGGLDILVVDEAVAYLDSEKSDRVIALMRAKLKTDTVKTVFFISNRDHNFEGSDVRHVHATLTNGVSTYDEVR